MSDSTPLPDLRQITVRPIHPEEEARWNELMQAHHYLGFRILVGESLKYVALSGSEWVALLGWGAAAFKCGDRDRWIGWAPSEQFRRLRYIANNQRFLILPSRRIPHLASRILGLCLRRLSSDWRRQFNHPILLAETFVDPSRFAGTCYKAAGWTCLGETRGFGRNGGVYYAHGQKKTIWVRALHPRAPAVLSAPFDDPLLLETSMSAIPLASLQLDGESGLFTLLRATMSDPRKARGIRHSYLSVLLIGLAGVLAGKRSYESIARWVQDLSQGQLRRLGCRWSPDKKRFLPPSEPTIRRILSKADPAALDQVLSHYVVAHSSGRAIAIDGKTIRSSSVGLMAALIHKDGTVAAQKRLEGPKGHEIPAAPQLLEPLDLAGKVVTADALHTQNALASRIREKGGDYVFTVKDNRKTLKDEIARLDNEAFSPSP
ncbi:MAG: ISAs1 family transposase [Nitrospiraceae bacterium]|nr:ISAs1 family transposase [Nitrospiraceae bacterium]